MLPGRKISGVPPLLRFVNPEWLSEAKLSPARQLNLRQPTAVGSVKLDRRWYTLWLQCAGPIPLVWVESRITGEQIWFTDEGKKKIDFLLGHSPNSTAKEPKQ